MKQYDSIIKECYFFLYIYRKIAIKKINKDELKHIIITYKSKNSNELEMLLDVQKNGIFYRDDP